VLNESGATIQETHYYPFGLEMAGMGTSSSTNKYLYNGKEKQTDFGLDWLDYGFRMMDPVIGRFWVQDPLMEWHTKYTPYHYCFNNPINFIDPLGLDTIKANSNEPVNKGDVVVLDNGTTVTTNIKEVTVRPSWWERFFSSIKNALSRADAAVQGNSTYKSASNTCFTTSSQSPNNENAKTTLHYSKILYINIDDILGIANFSHVLAPTGKVCEGPDLGVDLTQEVIGYISDKKINKENKTDKSGKPIDNEKEMDSIVEERVIEFDENTPIKVQKWKVHKNTNQGRPISKIQKK
jgi:RHS repeat-associated protein